MGSGHYFRLFRTYFTFEEKIMYQVFRLPKELPCPGMGQRWKF
jgi:hypothetical protein